MTQKCNQILAVSLALVFGFFSSIDSRACVASRDPRMNYFISYEKPYAGLFADGTAVKDIRPTIVDRCQGSGDYLMVALTLRTQKANGRTGDISFTNKLRDDSCKIVNNPFPSAQTYEDKLQVFEKQYQLLRSCTYYDIVDIDDNEIGLPPEGQPAAKIEILGKNHIRAEGDFVYLKARPNNRFAIGIGLKKECTRASTIRALGLQPGDLQALLNTYIAGDASGNTTDLTSIGSTRVRLALTAGSELMNVSSTDEPAEVPSWPTTFKTAVEFGTLSIKPENDARSRLDFTPLVDNLGARKCRNGICSSENSFQAPVAGMVELRDLNNTRRKVIDSWYFGASAPSQYQGFLESVSKYLDPGLIAVGKRYSIEMTMVDPYEDFLLFRSGLSQMMIDLTSLGSVAGLDVMQAFGGIATVTGMRAISGLGGMVGPDASQIIQAAMKEIEDFKGPQSWPPFFDKSCINKTGPCYSRGQTKFLKKIGAEFTIGELKEDLSYRLENMRIYSNDPSNGFIERINTKAPKIDCSGGWRDAND